MRSHLPTYFFIFSPSLNSPNPSMKEMIRTLFGIVRIVGCCHKVSVWERPSIGLGWGRGGHRFACVRLLSPGFRKMRESHNYGMRWRRSGENFNFFFSSLICFGRYFSLFIHFRGLVFFFNFLFFYEWNENFRIFSFDTSLKSNGRSSLLQFVPNIQDPWTE